MKLSLIVILNVLFFTITLNAQDKELEIYGWQDHFRYENFFILSASPSSIYASSNHGLIKIDKSDLSMTTFSKVEGLSDIDPYFIEYFEDYKALVIIYKNSNVDIVYENEVKNLPAIINNQNLLGKKEVLSIYRDESSSRLWITGGFGVTSIDMETGLFDVSILTDQPVSDFAKSGDYHYMLKGGKYYYFIGAENTSVVDFNEWTPLTEDTNFPEGILGDRVSINKGHLYLGAEDKIFASKLGSDTINQIFEIEGEESFVEFYVIDDRINAMSQQGLYDYNVFYEFEFRDSSYKIDTTNYSCSYGVTDIYQDGDRLYFGNNRGGLQYSENGLCEALSINSPPFSYIHKLEFYDGKLYATTGGITIDYFPTNTFDVQGYTSYDGDSWEAYNFFTSDLILENAFINTVQVLHDPNSADYYLASYYRGILKVDGVTGESNLYNSETSCFKGVVGFEDETRINAIALDEQGNLWSTNFLSSAGLVKLSPDGECTSYSFPSSSSKSLGDMVIDGNGNIWCTVVDNSAGIFVFNPETEETVVINTSNSDLPDNTVRALAIDLDGSIWAGSSNGVSVFSCGNNIFESICASVPVVDIEGDDVPDPLLLNQTVRTIAIDDGNRKWFGTSNGLIVQSSSSNKTIFRFNTENSPLPSNFINDIVINRETGLIYVGTDKGIISFKGDAVEANSVHAPTIISYPNPVRPEYQGPITISGLAQNAHVKITDQRGFVVTELYSRGGQAVWDGNNSSGERVASGVYMIYSSGQSNFEKPDAKVGKIVVIK